MIPPKPALGLLLSLLLAVLALGAGCAAPAHLAVAHGNRMTIVDPDTAQVVRDITAYQEVMRLAYRPDGRRLAAAVCFGNRIVELETTAYAEQAAPITAASCPWDVDYSPDGQSLAATSRAAPARRTRCSAISGSSAPSRWTASWAFRSWRWPIVPAARARRGHADRARHARDRGGLSVSRDGGRACARRASSTRPMAPADCRHARRLRRPRRGGGLATLSSDTSGAVTDIAVRRPAAGSRWCAAPVSVRREPDLVEARAHQHGRSCTDADFAPNGGMLAVAESQNAARICRAPAWSQELGAVR